jgi:hypothetical protein
MRIVPASFDRFHDRIRKTSVNQRNIRFTKIARTPSDDKQRRSLESVIRPDWRTFDLPLILLKSIQIDNPGKPIPILSLRQIRQQKLPVPPVRHCFQ